MELISKEDAIDAIVQAAATNGNKSVFTGKQVIALLRDVSAVPAIPIPKNVTNGKIMQAVFPHAKISQSDDFICLLVDGQGDAQMFDVDWWDVPYKRGDLL